jgi:hypothetical protein
MGKIIAFVSNKHVGKTLASKYLCDKYGYIKFSFADALKMAVKEIFGFTDDQLWGDNKETIDEYWNVSPRYILQIVGTDLFREQMKHIIPHIGENIWIRVAERKLHKLLNDNKNVVIDDLRFPNEAELIRTLGGNLIRIERPQLILEDTHISEQSNIHIQVNETIINDGTIQNYYHKIDHIMLQLMSQDLSKFD